MGTDTSESATPHAALLHRISGIVSSGRTLDAMLGELVGLAADVTSSDACLLYLIDPASDEIVLRASQLPHSAELGNLLLGMGEGITGWVAEHKAVVSLPSSASRDSRFKSFPTLVEDTYEALLSVPLVASGEVIGVINVHHRDPHEHAAEEIALLSFIGEQMGGAIARARLEGENARLQEETLVMKRELETRKLVERAKGILQRERQLTEEEAYLHLRNESRRQRRPMRELAEAIIHDAESGRPSAL
jgi:two-component system, response regulator PdtaR